MASPLEIWKNNYSKLFQISIKHYLNIWFGNSLRANPHFYIDQPSTSQTDWVRSNDKQPARVCWYAFGIYIPPHRTTPTLAIAFIYTSHLFTMDSARITQAYNELYIPTSPKSSAKHLPEVVPSLIMQDKTTDTTHHLSCGCCPSACIHQNAWWADKSAPVRPSLVPARSSSAVSTTSSSF